MPLPGVKLKTVMDHFTTALLAALVFTPTCDAFFRNLMIGDTAMARIDPIVSRGEPSVHVHHLTGGSNLNFESTGDTLSQSNCTSSLITRDKSAYWAPWMYFQHENGTFEGVDLALGLTAYYKYEIRGNTGGNVQYSIFPTGLNMVAGDSNKRSWVGPWPVPDQSLWGKEDTTQAALAEKAMGFNCMNYEPGKNEPSFAYPWLRNKDFLDENCINGIRAEIIFPSCWDGKNLGSSDHKSHVKYPTLIQDGICPDTHPIYLPILFYETIWQTNVFKGLPGQFVLSNGDPTGYGYHADFIAAWDEGVQEAVRDNSQCTGLSTTGEIESCPVFNGHIQTQEDARSCKLEVPEPIANEKTDGFLAALPGNVMVKGVRHDPGTQADANETYAPTSSLPASPTYTQVAGGAAASTGYYKSEVTSQSSSSYSQVTSQPIPPSPTTFATSSSLTTSASPFSTATTTYTSGNYVVNMVLVEMIETVTTTTAPTMTQTVVINGTQETSAPSKRHAHRHARKHMHEHDHY